MMLFDNVRIIKKANKKEDRFIFLMDKVRANKRPTIRNYNKYCLPPNPLPLDAGGWVGVICYRCL
jgi:hypothetical protein